MEVTLKYLESQSEAHPELAEWYATLADLYEEKFWHQLTLKLEQFSSLSNFKGFVANLETAPDGSVNLMIWKCIILSKDGSHWLARK